MTWHIIEGAEGCAYAKENRCTAVIVDALRASATAAALLASGATEIRVVKTVDEARQAKENMPHALLFGERGGLPPEGFDFGNSPLHTAAAEGKTVIFTTTSGAVRLCDAYGAHRLFMGSTVNAMALVGVLAEQNEDVVLIPTGNAEDPDFEADEDWAAAAAIADFAGAKVGEGALLYREWRQRLELDGLSKLFEQSPHGQKLLKIGFKDDVAFCAKMNVLSAVPTAVEECPHGVVLRETPH